jgi:hypothetical protein
MIDDVRRRGTPELIEEGASLLGRLAKAQIALALAELRVELKEDARRARTFAVAVVVAVSALNLFLVAAVLALAGPLAGWASALVVGGATALVAGAIAAVASRPRTRPVALTTAGELEEDAKLMKEVS